MHAFENFPAKLNLSFNSFHFPYIFKVSSFIWNHIYLENLCIAALLLLFLVNELLLPDIDLDKFGKKAREIY